MWRSADRYPHPAKSSTGLIGRIRLLNRFIVVLDPLIQHIEGFQQLGKPTPKAIRQSVFTIFQYLRNPATDLADPVANHNPVLTELPDDSGYPAMPASLAAIADTDALVTPETEDGG